MYSKRDIEYIVEVISNRGFFGYHELFEHLTVRKRGTLFSPFDARQLIQEAHKTEQIGSYIYKNGESDTVLASKSYLEKMSQAEKSQIDFSLTDTIIGISNGAVREYFLGKIIESGSEGYPYQDILDEMLELGYVDPDDSQKNKAGNVNRMITIPLAKKGEIYSVDGRFYHAEVKNPKIIQEYQEEEIVEEIEMNSKRKRRSAEDLTSLENQVVEVFSEKPQEGFTSAQLLETKIITDLLTNLGYTNSKSIINSILNQLVRKSILKINSAARRRPVVFQLNSQADQSVASVIEESENDDEEYGFSVAIMVDVPGVVTIEIKTDSKAFPTQQFNLGENLLFLEYPKDGATPYAVFNRVESITLKDLNNMTLVERSYSQPIDIYVYLK